MPMYCLYAGCLWSPDEVTDSPRTRVTGGWEPPCRGWEWTHGLCKSGSCSYPESSLQTHRPFLTYSPTFSLNHVSLRNSQCGVKSQSKNTPSLVPSFQTAWSSYISGKGPKRNVNQRRGEYVELPVFMLLDASYSQTSFSEHCQIFAPTRTESTSLPRFLPLQPLSPAKLLWWGMNYVHLFLAAASF